MKRIVVAIFALSVLAFGLLLHQPGGLAFACQSVEYQQDFHLTLVNRQSQLPNEWLNHIELVYAYNSLGEEIQVDKTALEHFEALRTELLKAGVDIELGSAYISIDEQQEIQDRQLQKYSSSYCGQCFAAPGHSEHHTGLAIDVFLIKNGKIIRSNEDMAAATEDFAKVHRLLAKHGFILRYMQGKETITGYAYAPWHFRYVGRDAAETITSQGITLEEYLEQLGTNLDFTATQTRP